MPTTVAHVSGAFPTVIRWPTCNFSSRRVPGPNAISSGRLGAAGPLSTTGPMSPLSVEIPNVGVDTP